jgi:hypothetical protein
MVRPAKPGNRRAALTRAGLILCALLFALPTLGAREATCAPAPDSARCIQNAIDQLASEGGTLTLEVGEYSLTAPLTISAEARNIVIEGSNESASAEDEPARQTVLMRNVDLPEEEGLLNIHGKGITLRNLPFGGNVLTSATIPYRAASDEPQIHGAPIYGNPMHPLLTKNSTVWVHHGSADIEFDRVHVRHTGGYAILIDARFGDIDNVRIHHSFFRNNRPHLFGNPNDLRYGSWTGGIHYQNDGRRVNAFTRYRLKNLVVEDCTFERISGHAVWGHGFGFDYLNEDIVVRNNTFYEIGLDAVQIGNSRNAEVSFNDFHRIGFITRTDTDPAEPAFYPGNKALGMTDIPAVGIDTTGYVVDSVYRDNRFVNVNGHFIDLDGFAASVVERNYMRISGREDAYGYAVDRVAEFGIAGSGNISKGINLSHTFAPEGARDVIIRDNIILNMGGYGIALNDSRRTLVERNHIRHYSVRYGPIVMLNTLRQPLDKFSTYDNIVRHNYIHFYAEDFCIVEADDYGYGNRPVAGPNFVSGNVCDGNLHGEVRWGARSTPHTELPQWLLDANAAPAQR